MKILFVLPALGKSVTTHLGIGHVSAALKVAGHETALLKINKDISEAKLLEYLSRFAPGLVAFGCVSHHWGMAARLAEWIKKNNPALPILVGGVHATVDPESVKACPHVDYIITGEGERAAVSLAAALSTGEKPGAIPGLCIRTDGGWECTTAAPFCSELDELPFPDRTIFGSERGGDLPIMAGRGCPFNCTYCCNHILKKVQEGVYVRMRSPEKVIREIKLAMKHQDVRRVIFEDDTFTLMKNWLKEFLPLYKNEVRIPFVANARAGNFDEETARALAGAGCNYVLIGVETGSDKLRKEILGRNMDNDQIIEAFGIAKAAGLSTYAFYMIGFPTETYEMALETLALHEKLNPEAGFQISVFYPYPNTRLWEITKEHGMLSPDAEKITFEGGHSTLKLKDMTQTQLESLYSRFEKMRLESSFSDRYIGSNYPWAALPVRLASALLGKARILRWAKAMRDSLEPAVEFRISTYDTEEAL